MKQFIKKHKNKSIILALFLTIISVFTGLILSGQSVNAMTQVNPNDPKMNTDNSLIISKNPEKHHATIDVSGTSPKFTKYAPEGEGNNFGRYDPNNNDMQNGGYQSFQSEYGSTMLSWDSNTLKPTDKITATYGVVGTYKGKQVTAKVIYSGFHGLPNNQSLPAGQHLILSDSLYSGYVFYGISNFTITPQFYYTDGSRVKFSSNDKTENYISFNSLNGAQNYGNPLNDRSEWASYSGDSYVTSSTILQELNGLEVGSYSGIGGMKNWNSKYDNSSIPGVKYEGFQDKLGAPTYTDATVVYKLSDSSPTFRVGSQRYTSETWNSLSSATIWGNNPDPPKKDVVQNDKSINGKIVNPNEKFDYTVTQRVNTLGQDILTKYNSFKITDKLPSEVNYLGTAYVTNDETGQKLTSDDGSFKYDDGVLTYEFSYNYLQNVMSYSHEAYTAHIPVQVKSDVKGETSINNKAVVNIDNHEATTNIVKNPTPKATKTNLVKKIFTGDQSKVTSWKNLFGTKADDSSLTYDSKSQDKNSLDTQQKETTDSKNDGSYDGKDALVDETKLTDTDDTADITFAEQFNFGNLGKFGSVTLVDNLDPAFTFKNAKILDKDGKDITDQGTLTSDNNKITWTAKNPESFRKTTVYMLLTVNLTKGYNFDNVQRDSQTGNYVIPNTANSIVDDKTYNSNEVHVLIPSKPTNPAPVKTVINANGKDINHQQVTDGDTIEYVIKQQAGTLGTNLLKRYSAFTFSDKLDQNLKYISSSVVTPTKDGNTSVDTTSEFDPKTNTVSWKASQDFLNAMPLKGELYEFQIKAQVKLSDKTLDGDNIGNTDGTINVTNKGTVTLNNDPQTTNEVENPVKPAKPTPPAKSVVDENGKDINHKSVQNGDKLTYYVDQTVGTLGKDLANRYKSFTISDKLDKNLKFESADVINADSKKVMSKPSEITLDKDTNTVNFNASKAFLDSMELKGETCRLRINVKVNADSTAFTSGKDIQFTNTATSSLNNQPQDTNEVDNNIKNVPTKDPKKFVTDKSGKSIDNQTVKVGDTLYYRVDQEVGTLGTDLNDRYKEFSITDPLDKGVTYQNAYVIDKKNGKTLSQPSDISFEQDSNTVHFSASQDFLDKMELKGETYELVAVAKVNSNAISNSNASNNGVSSNDSSKSNSDTNTNTKDSSETDTTTNTNDENTSNSDQTNNNDSTEQAEAEQDDTTVNNNVVKNIATVSLNGITRQTNEVKNPVEPSSDKPKTNPESPTNSNNPSNPAEPTSTEKLAQTGTKHQKGFLQKIVEEFFNFLK